MSLERNDTKKPLLRVRDLSFRYDSDGPALLRDLNLDIHQNDFVHIKGESGCGKSTLLRVLTRLADPDTGTLCFEGRPHTDYSVMEWRTQLVLVPQEPVMIDNSVRDNLLLPFTFAAFRDVTPPGDDRIRQWMSRFHLNGVDLHDRARKLSVGQRMRLAVIRALMVRPKIVLLDEPAGALDETSRNMFEQEIIKLRQDGEVAVVLVSHIPFQAHAERLRVLNMSAGILTGDSVG